MLEYAGFLHGVANKVAFGYEDRVKKNLFSRNIASTNTKKKIVMDINLLSRSRNRPCLRISVTNKELW
jgi:hypothetical protein